MSRRFRPPAQPTAFQALVLEYMWQQRPPLDVAELAHRLEMPPTTIYNWFHAGRVPHVSTLKHVARMTDISLEALCDAAGHEQQYYKRTPKPDMLTPNAAATKRLFAYMSERGIGRVWLAEKLGVTRAAVWHYEHTGTAMPSRRFEDACRALEVSPERFGWQTPERRVKRAS